MTRELAKKLERLSALNALLNMDEKGDDVIGMDDVPDAPKWYLVENGSPQGLKLAVAMADKPVQRASLKEKLAAYKAQVAGTGKQGIEKAKGKQC